MQRKRREREEIIGGSAREFAYTCLAGCEWLATGRAAGTHMARSSADHMWTSAVNATVRVVNATVRTVNATVRTQRRGGVRRSSWAVGNRHQTTTAVGMEREMERVGPGIRTGKVGKTGACTDDSGGGVGQNAKRCANAMTG